MAGSINRRQTEEEALADRKLVQEAIYAHYNKEPALKRALKAIHSNITGKRTWDALRTHYRKKTKIDILKETVRTSAVMGAMSVSYVFPPAIANVISSVGPAHSNPPKVSQSYSEFMKVDSKAISLLQLSYNKSTGLWNGADWWENANIMENTIEWMISNHSGRYAWEISNTFSKYSDRNFIIDNYNDDEGWWALAWIKAYDFTHNKEYLNVSKAIFANMTGSWDNTCGGGVWWDKNKTYKNAITNELFLRLALQLYQRTGDNGYLGWAYGEFNWFARSGMIDKSNLINDGLTRSCRNNNETAWTYTQGEFIGAMVDFANVSHKKLYLRLAASVANANDRHNVTMNGILYEKGCEPNNSCSIDGAEFKGVYIENLSYLYIADHNKAYLDFITRNAESIVNNDARHGFIGVHWDGPYRVHSTTTESAGAAALNAAVISVTRK